jgi:hypothetical protein
VTLASTVTIGRAADAIVVSEEARYGDLNASTTIENRLDPKNFSAVAYSVHNDPEGPQPSIAIQPAGATYQMSGAPAIVKPVPAAGAPAWVFAEEWASPFTIVPALVHATGSKVINAYYPAIVRGKVLAQQLSVVDVTAPRPDGVPAADASLGLKFSKSKRPFVSLWYDPYSFVVDVVELGDETLFARKP